MLTFSFASVITFFLPVNVVLAKLGLQILQNEAIPNVDVPVQWTRSYQDPNLWTLSISYFNGSLYAGSDSVPQLLSTNGLIGTAHVVFPVEGSVLLFLWLDAICANLSPCAVEFVRQFVLEALPL
jgi:hypothetical protein